MFEVGQTIGNYRITAKLGEGGMGVVYLAEHPVIGKKVAMKAIHPELARNNEVVSRFVIEAQAVNQIGHEHIVDISDFGTTPDGEFYFIMELLQGEPLAERLKRDGAIPHARAVNIGVQIADALDASHAHGIIHRDLKPENIFLLARGGSRDFVKVLDFGLAKLTLGEERVTHKTRTGSLMGTPYYMSPEQCEGRTEIDRRSDIYSLGVLLFEMLTGKVPFGGEGYGEIIVKHITMPAPSVRTQVPELPEELDAILYRALAKDRDQRFQTMAELRDALRDPAGYVAGAPSVSVPDDMSGIARAAAPMTRSEIDIRFGRTRLDGGGRGSGVVTQVASGTPSTFRSGIGQITDDEVTSAPGKRKTSKLLIAAAAVSMTAAALSISFSISMNVRMQAVARQQAARAAAPAARPSVVRVNFNSDPIGAAVVASADGKTIGKTPLSIELPYGDSALEFVLRKDGFEDKHLYVVPNLPSPLFATLQPLPVTKPAAVETPPAADATGKKSRRTKTAKPRLDDDAVLAPSFQ